MAARCLQSDHIYCDRRMSTALRHRGRLYTNGVSGRIALTITVPPESGERARWKWFLPRLRKLRVSRCSSEHRLRRRLRRSEEHTSELQSPHHLLCRLLLEKKNTKQ